ncbi:hypothetical protein OUZ56_013149 [Daphnia magna]|uniref:Uncharacterized protein n=1 Tax=Daphnia magna TaxID=35525 RepID=A0ABQ9Z529_9CRUS|nr:hypothetical protein OUZ56_013149 [Daphnia magna]
MKTLLRIKFEPSCSAREDTTSYVCGRVLTRFLHEERTTGSYPLLEGGIKPSERTLASVTGCKLQGNDARPKAKIALNPTGPFGWEQLP